jgi:hypothetical protein
MVDYADAFHLPNRAAAKVLIHQKDLGEVPEVLGIPLLEGEDV